MTDDYMDMEIIDHYFYKEKEYYLEIFITEDHHMKVYASFQIDVENESDDIVGLGVDEADKNKAIIKAIQHLHSQFH